MLSNCSAYQWQVLKTRQQKWPRPCDFSFMPLQKCLASQPLSDLWPCQAVSAEPAEWPLRWNTICLHDCPLFSLLTHWAKCDHAQQFQSSLSALSQLHSHFDHGVKNTNCTQNRTVSAKSTPKFDAMIHLLNVTWWMLPPLVLTIWMQVSCLIDTLLLSRLKESSGPFVDRSQTP